MGPKLLCGWQGQSGAGPKRPLEKAGELAGAGARPGRAQGKAGLNALRLAREATRARADLTVGGLLPSRCCPGPGGGRGSGDHRAEGTTSCLPRGQGDRAW